MCLLQNLSHLKNDLKRFVHDMPFRASEERNSQIANLISFQALWTFFAEQKRFLTNNGSTTSNSSFRLESFLACESYHFNFETPKTCEVIQYLRPTSKFFSFKSSNLIRLFSELSKVATAAFKVSIVSLFIVKLAFFVLPLLKNTHQHEVW